MSFVVVINTSKKALTWSLHWTQKIFVIRTLTTPTVTTIKVQLERSYSASASPPNINGSWHFSQEHCPLHCIASCCSDAAAAAIVLSSNELCSASRIKFNVWNWYYGIDYLIYSRSQGWTTCAWHECIFNNLYIAKVYLKGRAVWHCSSFVADVQWQLA